MKLSIYFLAFCFVLVCNMQAQPKLQVVGGNTYDWKTVSAKQERVQAKIYIKNIGTSPLIIGEVKPGCGCTTAPIDKKEIVSGDSATLDVTLNVGASSGEIFKSISIKSNDPEKPQDVIYLKANVIQTIQLSPQRQFTFLEMKIGYDAEAKMKMKNNSQQVIKFTDVEVDPKNMMTNIVDGFSIKPGEEVEVFAKVKPDKVGYFRCFVKMKTDNPDYKEFKIDGYGNVQESKIFNP